MMMMSRRYAVEGMYPLIKTLLTHVGEDAGRPGLADTPKRVMAAWEFMTSGYHRDPLDVLKSFDDGAAGCDELIFQSSIPVWSTCEHHMLPFFGVAHIGYLPNGRILGLSKFSRLIEVFARRLQVQERLTVQVASALMDGLEPFGVGVVLQCRHTCMEARGVQQAGTVTTTTALRGRFKSDLGLKAEFLDNVRMAAGGMHV
jgi:GTP cyclohydrolase I